MSNQSFTINVVGMKLSIGERVIHLNEKLALEDAKAVASQYPKSNYITFVDLIETSNDDNSRGKVGDSLGQDDAQGQSQRRKRKSEIGEVSTAS